MVLFSRARLVVGVAGLLILATSAMSVSAAGIDSTTAYYSQLVAQSTPQLWCELGDIANGYSNDNTRWVNQGLDRVSGASTGKCQFNGQGPGAGLTATGTGAVGGPGGVLTGYRFQGYGSGAVATAFNGTDSLAVSEWFNTNAYTQPPSGVGTMWLGAAIGGLPGGTGLGVWTSDNFSTICFGVKAGVNHCSDWSGGLGHWVMVTLVYHRTAGTVALWVNGSLWHTLMVGSSVEAGGGQWVESTGTVDGQWWWQANNWRTDQNIVMSGVGLWQGAGADALDQPVSAGSNVNWIQALYSFVPVAAQPNGTVCTPNADGTHTCTVPLNAPGAPLSGSHNKFQFGYQTLDTCVTPTSWTDFGAFIPYALCVVGNAIKAATNVLTFMGNALLDLVLPDEGRQAAEFKAFNDDVSTRGPFGIGNSLLGGLQTAQGATTFGSASVSGNGTVTSTGGGTISNSVWSVTMPASLGGQTVTVDLATSLAFMNSSILGITLHGLASAGVLFAFVPLILRRFTQDLRT